MHLLSSVLQANEASVVSQPDETLTQKVSGFLRCRSFRIDFSSGAVMNSVVLKTLESTVILDVQNVSCGRRHAALITKHSEIYTWGKGDKG